MQIFFRNARLRMMLQAVLEAYNTVPVLRMRRGISGRWSQWECVIRTKSGRETRYFSTSSGMVIFSGLRLT